MSQTPDFNNHNVLIIKDGFDNIEKEHTVSFSLLNAYIVLHSSRCTTELNSMPKAKHEQTESKQTYSRQVRRHNKRRTNNTIAQSNFL